MRLEFELTMLGTAQIAQQESTFTNDLLVALIGALVAVLLTYGVSWVQIRRSDVARRRKLLRLLALELGLIKKEADTQATPAAAVVARPTELPSSAWNLLIASGVAAELESKLLEDLASFYRLVDRVNHLRGAHDFLVLISQLAPHDEDRDSALDGLTRVPSELAPLAHRARDLLARVDTAAKRSKP